MKKETKVQKNLTLIYWKGKRYWLGKLVENPEIMSQGRTLKELVENIKDAALLIAGRASAADPGSRS